MSVATAPCPRCGQPASGNFCTSCGAGLTRSACSGCGSQVAAGAAFCHRCGQALGQVAPTHQQTGGSPTPSNPVAWWVAGLLVVIAISGVVYSLRGRDAAPAAAMANDGNANPLAGTPAPDISNMSPTERFMRLHNRILDASEKGDTNTVVNFWPMTVGAYQNLTEAERTVDIRYHMATLYLLMPLYPEVAALADTILKQSPNNLAGYYLQGMAAAGQGNSSAATAAQALFLKHYPTEITKDHQEYLDHRPVFDQYFRQAGGK